MTVNVFPIISSLSPPAIYLYNVLIKSVPDTPAGTVHVRHEPALFFFQLTAFSGWDRSETSPVLTIQAIKVLTVIKLLSLSIKVVQ